MALTQVSQTIDSFMVEAPPNSAQQVTLRALVGLSATDSITLSSISITNALTANSGTFNILSANSGTFNTLSANVGSFNTLSANSGTFVTLSGNYGGFVTLSARSSYFDNLSTTNPLAIIYGGTGANTAAQARTNFGLGTIAQQNSNNVYIAGGGIESTTIGLTAASTGNFTSLTASGNIWSKSNTSSYIWGANGDTLITRDALSILAQRNSTAAQTFRVYNTFTDASNYERAGITWSSNVLSVGTEQAGTGSGRATNIIGTNINLRANGAGTSTGQITINTTGDVAISSTTANSTNPTSGSLQVAGGVGIGGGLYIQSFAVVNSTSVWGFTNRGGIRSTSDGDLTIRNNSNNAFGTLVVSTLSSANIIDTGKTVTPPGTVGARTINSMSGSVNFATAATSLVVTSSVTLSSSIIIATKATADATARLGAVVPTAGSFTIFMDTAPTAETRVNYLIIN